MSSSIRYAALMAGILLLACSDDTSAPADLAVAEASPLDRSVAERGRSDGGPSCDELKAELLVQVELAKSCQPQSASKECTRLINQDALPCGCPIFINPAHTEAIARIDELLLVWRRKDCGAKIECKPCAKPTAATCEATPQGSKVPGLCKSSR